MNKATAYFVSTGILHIASDHMRAVGMTPSLDPSHSDAIGRIEGRDIYVSVLRHNPTNSFAVRVDYDKTIVVLSKDYDDGENPEWEAEVLGALEDVVKQLEGTSDAGLARS